MSLFRKLLTAFRGAGAEAGEALVDAQAFRIAAQEQRDAEAALHRARHDLIAVMAEAAIAQRHLQHLNRDIAARENQVRASLAGGREDLAQQIAVKLAEMMAEAAQQEALVASLTGKVARLRDAIGQIEFRLAELRRRFKLVRATASVQRAEQLVRGEAASGVIAIADAQATLGRIVERQEQTEARLEARMMVEADKSGERLDTALQNAGLLARPAPDAAAIIARLRAEAA